ncbi:unnamed protein product [Adineta steineri]|uniref:G-protein coupled receptors family 1 profile domain-containing protein n=1 Tax=Adineta steineri TaxID=433720 RepID=A0A814UN19_9BILA|nr:unnamed protein product [Adineta steineri]
MSVPWSTIEVASVCFFIIIIILLTVGGNLVVLFAFYTDPHLLTPSNHFLLSMAIADLLVGLIAMPFHSFAQIKGSWPFGELFCKVWLTIDDVATMASVLSIVAITIERFWSINHSVHYRRHTNKTRIRIFSVFIWLIPFLNFAPGIWLLNSNEETPTTNITRKAECIGAYHSHTIYLIVAQINFFAWPLVVIIILNALIVVNLYRRSQHFPTFSPPGQRKNKTLSEIKEENIDEDQEQQDQMIDNDEVTLSIINDNNYHMLKRMDLEGNNDDHFVNIPPPITEVDEQLNEDDIVNCQTLQKTIPSSSSTGIIDTTPSTSEFYTRIRKAFFTSSQSTSVDYHTSKAAQTFQVQPQRNMQKRRSIFAWRTSSINLSPRNINNTVTGEQRTVRRLRRDKRAATSLLILVLVFMIFLLPYVVVVVAGNISSLEILKDTSGQLYSAVFWLLWLNSTVNPILYPFIQPKFRDAYRRIFIRITRRRRRLASLIADMQRAK